jgi:hypothetical protein
VAFHSRSAVLFTCISSILRGYGDEGPRDWNIAHAELRGLRDEANRRDEERRVAPPASGPVEVRG